MQLTAPLWVIKGVGDLVVQCVCTPTGIETVSFASACHSTCRIRGEEDGLHKKIKNNSQQICPTGNRTQLSRDHQYV
jgi:hypothetical protein